MGANDNPVTAHPRNVESTGEQVSRLRFRISTSLDGFVAGPNQSLQEPLGIGGERLHEWVVALIFQHSRAADAKPWLLHALTRTQRARRPTCAARSVVQAGDTDAFW